MWKTWFCLLLAIMLGCSGALAEDMVSLAPYTSTDAEIAYASLLGLDEPYLVYTYAADCPSALQVTTYAWQENAWKLANMQYIPLDCPQGRIALFPEELEKQLRVTVQCPHENTTLTCHPLFGLSVTALTSSQVSLCEAAVTALGEEIPVILQSCEEMSLADFAAPHAVKEPAWAVTLTFVSKEDVP